MDLTKDEKANLDLSKDERGKFHLSKETKKNKPLTIIISARCEQYLTIDYL